MPTVSSRYVLATFQLGNGRASLRQFLRLSIDQHISRCTYCSRTVALVAAENYDVRRIYVQHGLEIGLSDIYRNWDL